MRTLALLLGGILPLTFLQTACADGTVLFNNDSTTMITNCTTRLPQTVRTIKLGLYFTVDLSAASDPVTRASMVLAKVTTNAPIDGRFLGGIATLAGVPNLFWVVLQVKAWPTNYATYEEALAAGADVAESLPWVQQTGGSINPPTMISRWGFRPFLYPHCEPMKVPLFVEKNGNKVRVNWPVGLPPTVQVNDGSGRWQTLTSGTFVQDHWEFEVTPTNRVQFFRLAQ